MSDRHGSGSHNRRQFLKYTGAASTVAMAGMAGCLGDDDNGDDTGNGSTGGEDYPTDDIRLIIPFDAGGGTDAYLREIAPLVAEEMGVNIPIDNVSGAASLRGTGEMMMSDPDGYTVGAFNPPSTPVSEMVNPQSWALEDCVGLGLYAEDAVVLVGNPDYEIEGYDDLVSRYNDGELENFGGLERGGLYHVMALVMREEHDINWSSYIGYSGTGPSVEAAMSGEVPVAMSTDTAAAAAVEDGAVDLVAVLPSGGSAVFPDQESVPDLGYDELDFLVSLGRIIAAPPGTPDAVVEAWEDALSTVMNSDEMAAWSEETGNVVMFEDGTEVENRIQTAYDTIPEIVDLDEIREASN